ncbi:MAG: adenylate/guanylate cyclase domain-containing protein [Acidobacteriota bacterium]
MPAETQFEISHVLFIDIVGYSKMLIDDQREVVRGLNTVVRACEQFRAAEAAGKLLRLPSGDGMALAFFTAPDGPVRCAIEIARALRTRENIPIRMGIHSGPVSRVADVNEAASIAGAGINMAQRVMDCGEAGHILISQRVAEDLSHFREWAGHLHDLGEREVKHGLRLRIYNLYGDDFGEPAVPALAPGQTQEQSVAVLPLVDLSEAKDQDYLCDGLSEELMNSLGRIAGLRVAARTSAFSFKGKNTPVSEIAAKLGVANLIEGNLRRSGNRIRVTLQLINPRTGFNVWSEMFERELRDVFAVQDEITHAVVEALRIKLSAALPVHSAHNDADANDLYLRGLHFSSKSSEEELRQALSYFQGALDRDPKLSRAWSGIAKVWSYMADAYVRPLDAYPIVHAAAEKALAIDERNAEAHCRLGFAKAVLNWDHKSRLRENRRAVEIDPNSAWAHMELGNALRGEGDLNGALDEYRAAVTLDPLSPIVSEALAIGYMIAGRLDEAIAQAKHTFELAPSYVYLDSNLATAYREKGLFDLAIPLYLHGEQSTHAPSRGLAIAYAHAGMKAEAEQKLAELLARREKQYASAAAIGIVYGALGSKDEAFRWLERAYNDHDAVLTTVAFYPGSEALRDDPRFIDLVKRVGLDPTKAIPISKA